MSSLPLPVYITQLRKNVLIAQKYHTSIADLIHLINDEEQTFDSLTIRIVEENEFGKTYPLLNEADSAKVCAISPLGVQVFHQAFNDNKEMDDLTRVRLFISCQSEAIRLLLLNRWQLRNAHNSQPSIHTMSFSIAVLARGEQLLSEMLFEIGRLEAEAWSKEKVEESVKGN